MHPKSRTATLGLAAAAVAAIVAGCGSSSSGSGNNQTVSPAGNGTSATLTTHSTSIGTVVADSNGRTVYELIGNPASNSKCTTSCQAIWPPVMSGNSIKALHGHPLFTFSGDSGAGQTNGQGVKDSWGLWLALGPNGQTIPAGSSAPSSPPAGSSSGGGGYGY